MELAAEFLQPHRLLVDDVVFVLQGLLLVPDHLVEFLDAPVAALYLADGLQPLELVFLLHQLVFVLQLQDAHLHQVFLALHLLLPLLTLLA